MGPFWRIPSFSMLLTVYVQGTVSSQSPAYINTRMLVYAMILLYSIMLPAVLRSQDANILWLQAAKLEVLLRNAVTLSSLWKYCSMPSQYWHFLFMLKNSEFLSRKAPRPLFILREIGVGQQVPYRLCRFTLLRSQSQRVKKNLQPAEIGSVWQELSQYLSSIGSIKFRVNMQFIWLRSRTSSEKSITPLPTRMPFSLILNSELRLQALIRRARSGMNLPAYDQPAIQKLLPLKLGNFYAKKYSNALKLSYAVF